MTGSWTPICCRILLPALLLGGCDTTPNGLATTTTSRSLSLYGPGVQPTSGPDQQGGLQQVSFSVEGVCTDPCLDPRGRTIAFASNQHGPNYDIYVRPTTGTSLTRITSDPGEDVMPAFSPDGLRITFASNRAGQYDIYVVDLDGGHPVRMTNDLADEYHPTWSADGRYIAWSRTNPTTKRNELWAVDLQQPARAMFLEYGTMPEWSPDPTESTLVFQRARQRGSRLYGLWTIELKDGQPGRPTEIVSAANAATINPTWSPDGSAIAFSTVTITRGMPQEDTLDLWTVQRDGTRLQHVTRDAGDEYLPSWAADGRLYFVSERTGAANIWSVSVETPTTTEASPRFADAAPDDP